MSPAIVEPTGSVVGVAPRTALVRRFVADAVLSLARPGQSGRDTAAVTVLDCGGGSGTYAVPVAMTGAQVVVVDLSADALATLRRRAQEAGVTERVRAIAGDVEQLDSLLPVESVDLALVHGVLEAVDDPRSLLAALVRTVRAGGLISLLVRNPAADVLARAVSGQPLAALRALRTLDVDEHAGARPDDAAFVDPQTVLAWCERAGLVLESRRGVGAISDLVPGSAADTADARDALLALDAETADLEPFAGLGSRIHLLLRRPADGATMADATMPPTTMPPTTMPPATMPPATRTE